MSKPMTNDQIETELGAIITECRGKPHSDLSVLRQAFTLGTDHGKAIILERADELLKPAVGDAFQQSIGRSVMILCMWAALNKGRNWSLNTLGETPSVWLTSVEVPEIHAGKQYHYLTGSDICEAFALAAAWCEEHTKAALPKSADETPAPATTATEDDVF